MAVGVYGAEVYGQDLNAYVANDKGPVALARVYVQPGGLIAESESNGYFVFKDLKMGDYVLHIESEGHFLLHQKIKFPQEVPDTFFLKVNHTNLPTVLVQSELAAYSLARGVQSVQVLDANYLESRLVGTLANSLEKLPGLSSINTGSGISKPVIRGMAFNRIQVRDKGIKQEGQQWGADHGLEIDAQGVDRVEVIKGPSALLYGSDGLGGVILINPPLFPTKGFRAQYRFGLETNNWSKSHSVGLVKAGEKTAYKIRFTAIDYEDYRVPAEDFVYAGFRLPIYNQRLANTAGSEKHGSAEFYLKHDGGFSTWGLSVYSQKAGLFPGAVGIPNEYNLAHNGHDGIDFPRQENQHWKGYWNVRRPLGKRYLEMDIGFQRNLRRERSFPHVHGYGSDVNSTLALGLNLNTYSVNLLVSDADTQKIRFVYGFQGQYMENRKQGFEFLLPNHESFMAGAFGSATWRVSKPLSMQFGLRYDAAGVQLHAHRQPIYRNRQPTGEFEYRSREADRFFHNLSVSFGLSYAVNAFWQLKSHVGSSFRMPTAVELGMNGMHHGNFRFERGNVNLSPERGFQWDAELVYRHHPLGFSFSPFVAVFYDYIYLAPSGQFPEVGGMGMIWNYRQNHVFFAGGEWLGHWQIGQSLSLESGLEVVYNRNLDSELPLPLTPPVSLLNRLEWQWKPESKHRFWAYAEWRQTAAQNRVDRNERSTAGFGLLELGAGLKFGWLKQEWKLVGKAQNVMDAAYYNHLSRYRQLNLPEPGRNVMLSLVWQL